MEIVHFTSQDQLKVSRFWEYIFLEMGWKVNRSDGFDDISAYLHFPEGFFLIVREGENIVGCGGVKPLTDTIGIVKRFYILADLRGKGVASRLLQRLIDESREHGFTQLVLDVWNKNPRASRFYEKHGFERYLQESYEKWAESQKPEIFFYYRMMISPIEK